MLRNRLIFAVIATLLVVAIVLSAHSVSAGEGTGGHLGGIIATFF